MSQKSQIEFETPMLKFLQSKGIDFNEKSHVAYKLVAKGFMDLTVETWVETSKAGSTMKISVCHYGEQNGDLMTDPEIVYKWDMVTGIEIPVYYKNDYTGLVQEVYSVVEGKHMINPSLLKDLQSFTKQWVKNLKEQGFEMKPVEGVTN